MLAKVLANLEYGGVFADAPDLHHTAGSPAQSTPIAGTVRPLPDRVEFAGVVRGGAGRTHMVGIAGIGQPRPTREACAFRMSRLTVVDLFQAAKLE